VDELAGNVLLSLGVTSTRRWPIHLYMASTLKQASSSRLDALRLKSARTSLSVSRAEKRISDRFVLSNLDDRLRPRA
jgi:hypothetical protein